MKHRYFSILKNTKAQFLVTFVLLLGINSAIAQTYCTPTYSNSCWSWGTTSVNIGTFSHSPACGTTNYLSQTVNLSAGVPTSVSFSSIGWCGVGMAADFNMDGDFSDPGEILDTPNYIAQSVAVYTGTITVPASVPTGSYRLRVWNRTGNAGGSPNYDACGSYAYGRYQDYTLSVLGSGSCHIPGLVITGITQNSASATITPPTAGNTPSAYIYELREYGTSAGSGPTGLVSSGMQTGTTINMTGLYQGAFYELFVRSFCGATDTSIWSGIVFNASSDTMVPVPLDNFSDDVVANGIGGAALSTTNDVDGANWALVAADFKATATSNPPNNSIPMSRSFNNNIKKYKMQDYATDNSLRMTNGSSGTIHFLAPKRANSVHIMGVSGSGASTTTATLHFDDGSSQQATLYYPDWYNTGNNVAAQVGRVNTFNNTLQSGPYLHDSTIVVNIASRNKQIDSISFSNSGAVMNVLAVSVIENNQVSCTTPKNLDASNIGCNTATLTWDGNGSATNYQISYGPVGLHADTGTMIAVSGTATSNTYSFTNGSSATDIQVYLRADCGSGDYSDWMGPLDLTFTPLVPTFSIPDTICEGTSGITLNSTSTNSINGTWMPATVDSTVTTTYTFTPASGQCAVSYTHTITVNPEVIPAFAQIPDICQGDVPPVLPTTSTDGILGTWSPSTVDNMATGTYTFTPNSTSGTCATSTMLTVNVLPASLSSEQDTICSSDLPYLWHGQTISFGGVDVAFDTLGNAAGCDSIIALSLYVNSAVTPTLSYTANPGTQVPEGTQVTFEANVTNGGINLMYNWYLNGTPITGATSSTWVAISGTDFNDGDHVSVFITDMPECSTVDTLVADFNMIVTVGIKNIALRPGFKIYPNPSHDIIYLEGLHIGDAFRVYDILGREIYTGQQLSSEKSAIALSDWPVSNYMVIIETEDGKSWFEMIQKD